MKKKLVAIVMALTLLFGVGSVFAGCNPSTQKDGLVIYTSMYPIFEFTQKIVGEKATVINLVGPGEEAHHYELKVQQRAELETRADLLIINGLDMEHWAEDLPQVIQSKTLIASKDVQTIEVESSGGHDEHDDEEEGGVLRTDPHAWLSLRNAKVMMNTIKEKMIELDRENSAYYENNFARQALLLDLLDQEFTTTFSAIEGKSFVVSHKAFGYLSNDYGLTQVSISGLDSDDESSGQTMEQIIAFINQNNIKTVFYNEAISSSLATAIANRTEATIEVLYTVESLSQQQINNGENFLSLMAHNLIALRNALR